jgi:hypothetical protein
MSFLPILERELRVATRKRSTGWLRVVAALIALIIGSGFLAINMVTGTATAHFGQGLFGTVTWLALATALAAGPFFTADCLSEEKREGTLGFLFLTDLRGLDVVGGKLLATSLRGSYALLAIFPILAVTLVMGGVTGAQFWRCTLAILNALFCSLAVGLAVSSVSRDSQRALAGTFLLLLMLCAVGPIMDPIVMRVARYGLRLSYSSPAYAFWAANAWGRSGFWTALCVSHCVGWIALGLAGILVRRTWQDRPKSSKRLGGVAGYQPRYGRSASRQAKRRKLLEPNPVVWLVLRDRWQAMAVWLITAVVLGCFSAIALRLPPMIWIVWGPVSWIVLAGLYLWIASQACRFFIEARRSGLLEVLLVTPLRSVEVIHGQWSAFLRSFSVPISVLVLVLAAGVLLSRQASFSAMSAARGGAAGVSWFVEGLTPAMAAANTIANLIALIWVGMWMGLTTKSGSMAALKTLLFVQVLPTIAIYFVSTIVAAAVMFGGWFRSGPAVGASSGIMLLFPLVQAGTVSALILTKDAAFFFWASRNLRERFRVEAAQLENRSASTRRVGLATRQLPPMISGQP